MSEVLKELAELAELLKLEKEEDLEQYKQMIQQLPLEKRKEQGYTWYPLQVAKQGYTYGNRAYVIVEYLAAPDTPHHFRAGKVVSLYTRQPTVSRPARTGVIQFVDKTRMKIVLNTEDLPEWLGLGLLGVDLLFDETTYLEMEKAVRKVQDAKKGRLAELRAIIYGQQAARFSPIAEPIVVPGLNDAQNKAVNHILAAQDVAVIHGPPGTGKTTTLVQAVRLLAQQENTVLVTAPSNTAVDLLTERLAEAGLEVTRIGNLSRVDESIISHTLDMKLSNHPEAKNIKKVKVQAAEARRKAKRYKRSFGREERTERQQLWQEARELSAWARQLEGRLVDQILDSSQVITATMVGAGHELLGRIKFRTAIIDEAAQALEPASWIPITKASRIILAGDPYQLPPTVKSQAAKKGGLGTTLIEKLLQRLSEVRLLHVQYRMNEAIMGFSNRQFYHNALEADESVRHHRLPIEDGQPVTFIDTAGCGFEEKMHEKFRSRFNTEEFMILREHLYLMQRAFEGKEFPSTALISPYREQALLMKKLIEEEESLLQLPLSINTIDGFQGQERDVVYISLVRSNSKNEIGFLRDYRRMNVAMTRARKKLIVVGDSATIGNDDFYRAFLEYCEEKGAYQSAWAYMQA